MLSASIAKAPMSVGVGLATKEMASAAFVSWNNFPFMNDRGKDLILYWPWKKYTLKVYSKKANSGFKQWYNFFSLNSLWCTSHLGYLPTELSYHGWWIHLNPLAPKSDKHLISPYNITPKSHIKVTRKKEMISNDRSSGLLNKFSLSAP